MSHMNTIKNKAHFRFFYRICHMNRLYNQKHEKMYKVCSCTDRKRKKEEDVNK